MKICPECKHANSNHAETCEKCLAILKSEKKIIDEELLVSKIEQNTDYFPATEILSVLIILYGVISAIIGLIKFQFIDFQFIFFILVGLVMMILSLEIKTLKRQIVFLNNQSKPKSNIK